MDEFIRYCVEQGYVAVRKLPVTEQWVGVMPMNFTCGLFVGLDETGYAYRYCYPTLTDAVMAAATWTGEGDPPGPWIKLKGHPEGERLGPGAVEVAE